jgi:molybdate transport system substrate-binding protein
MQYVASGESPLGIVYRSDLYHAKGVKEVAKFATGLHPAIRYPAAVISAHATEEARAFIEFINSPEAADLWVGFGFDPLLAQ